MGGTRGGRRAGHRPAYPTQPEMLNENSRGHRPRIALPRARGYHPPPYASRTTLHASPMVACAQPTFRDRQSRRDDILPAQGVSLGFASAKRRKAPEGRHLVGTHRPVVAAFLSPFQVSPIARGRISRAYAAWLHTFALPGLCKAVLFRIFAQAPQSDPRVSASDPLRASRRHPTLHASRVHPSAFRLPFSSFRPHPSACETPPAIPP